MLKRLWASPLVRSSGIYTIAGAISSAIPFLMIPVLTRYLTTTDYGIVSMVAVLVGIAGPFVGLSINGAISVRFFQVDRESLARYVGNCLFLALVSSLIVSVVVVLFADQLSAFTSVPKGWLAAVVALSVGQVVTLVLLALWQVNGQAIRYGVFQMSAASTNVALSLLFVVTFGFGWRGRTLAQVFAVVLFAIVALVIIRQGRWVIFERSSEDLRHALRFGIPLVPHALGGMLFTQTDRFFLTNMIGVSETGIYTVGFQVGMIIELLAGSFNRAYAPWLYGQLRGNDEMVKRRIVRFTYVYFAGILVVAAVVVVATRLLLPYVVGASFLTAMKYVPWIAFGFAFSGMYYMVANYVFFANATHILATVTFVTALANIGFNYVLISVNGAVGAAQATCLAFLISFLMTWILSARVYRMPWRLRSP